MNITFWVTEKCNLACKYCYVHKQPKTMTLETAEQTIKYFTDKFDETVAAGKRINVALHGGEPLLNFDVIRYIVETLKERYDGHIIFTMTTNGTVFEKDIYDFIKGKVQISVSIDGNRTTNDTNRIYPNGESSFDKVMETLKFLKEQGEYIRVRMTVNKETLPAMAENYIYLDQMDMGVVTFALDAGAAWNQQDMQIYYENYEKIMDYINRPLQKYNWTATRSKYNKKIGYVDSDGNKVFLPGESEEKYQNMKNDYGKRMRFNFVTITPDDIPAFPGSQVGDIYTDIQTPEIDYASITNYEDMLIAGVPALYRITNGKITEFYFDSVEIEEFFNSIGR